jgi:class 3 adenylate cyclase/tetratricopeptide (TPR) repeat protein
MGESGLITILFTDLVGSTALAQEMGDEAADRLRRDHFEHLRRAVTATNGTEVKTIGDAMMVSYNSASDAVAGAVAMQQSVHDHNEDLASPIEMRVGISAGDASFEDGDWFGTPVVEASRLCGAAAGGQVLVTDIVRILGGSRVTHELVPIGAIEGKGLPAPLSACEVLWEPASGGASDRLDLPLPPLVEQDDVFGFVGRAEQWEKLWLAWKTATVTGRHAVFVAGEPGIGKTRLVKELCRSAHDSDGIVLWGTCDDELALPYQPFVEAFRWLAASTAPDTLAGLLGPIGGELTPLVPDLHQRLPGLGPRLNDDPDTERHRLFEAATELLRNLSARKPVVLVIDDVHWARKPTLLLLRHLLRTSVHLNVLVVATYRDTDLDRTHPLSEMLADLRRQVGVERIALRGLDGPGVQQFLTHTAGHELDDRGIQLAEAIARETEGNPFFIGEVLRHLAESGALVQRDGRWDSDTHLDEIGIPEGVREVIGRRLSHLDSATNDVLAAAAVIGRDFELRTLGAVVGSDDAALDAIESAETAGLVEPVRGRPGTYRFAHALVRSALYDELPTSRRLRLHRSVGLALEASGASSVRLTELARHFTEAAALGEIDKAVDYCRRAGEAAIDDLAYEEAALHFERALDTLQLRDPVDEGTYAELVMAAGNALHQIGEPRGRDLLHHAEQLGRARDDVELLARVSIALAADWVSRQNAGVDEHAVGLAEHVLRHADRLPDDLHARTLGVLSIELFWSSDVGRRLELCERALEIARRLDDASVLAFALESRSMLADLTEPGALEASAARATETIEVASGIDDALVCGALANRSIVHVCRGDLEAGEHDLHGAEELADRLRIPRLISQVKMLRTARALLAGQLDAADALLADYEAHAIREGRPNPAAVGSIRYRLQYERGQLAELEPFLVQIIEAQPQIPVWRMALCGVYLQTERPELVRPHVEAVAADDFAMVQRNQAFLLTCSSTARIAAQVDAREAAEAAYRHAAAFDDVFPFSGACYEYPVGIGVGAAAGALGWYDRAEQHFARAIELCERAEAPTYLAAARLHLAEMLVRRGASGDGDRARTLAASALRTASDLGLAYVRTRAEKLLDERIGGPR